jgi:LmbE family N-acetylglucosaminyl deacetylase
MTTVVFSPHPDDEAIACGGVIAKKAKSGEKVRVVFMTDGRNSHKASFGIVSNPTPADLKSIRKKESAEAAGIMGLDASDLGYLDFEDGSLQEKIHVAIGSVMQCLLVLNPSEVYLPSQTDGHRDHSATSTIVLAAISTSDFNLDIYEYKIWRDAGVNPEEDFRPDGMVEMDISAFVGIKKRAISAYKSQTTVMFPLQKKPVLDEKFILNFTKPVERFRKFVIRSGQAVA